MKNILKVPAIILSLLLIAMTKLAAEQTEAVKLADVPAPVQKIIHEKSGQGHGKLGDIEKVTDEGETWYEVGLVKGKVERNFTVSVEGKLLTWQVFTNELPEPALKEIESQVQLAKAKLGDIDRVVDEGKTNYDVDMSKNGKDISFSVSAAGKLLSIELAITETPAAVQAAIRNQANGGIIKSIEKDIDDEDGEVTYDIEIERAGKKTSYTFDPNGKLVED